MKVVINRCYGGFSLSDEAIRRYAELKGLTLYPEEGEWGLITYWTVPPEDRPQDLSGDAWRNASLDERKAYNEAYAKSVLYDRDIPRDDVHLAQVVEELGEKANGDCANLQVTEIPDGVAWEVEEYDGNEWVAEVHRTWR
jgi:hypothetical protein